MKYDVMIGIVIVRFLLFGLMDVVLEFFVDVGRGVVLIFVGIVDIVIVVVVDEVWVIGVDFNIL